MLSNLVNVFRAAQRRSSRKSNKVLGERSHIATDIPSALYTAGKHIEISLPSELLVMQGGFAFDEKHPFIAALREGPQALTNFYAAFRPKTLSEMYKLPCKYQRGEDLPPWTLGWLERDAPPGEHGLDVEHGISYYGPCTQEKILLEHERLSLVVRSVETHGYRPDFGEGISGNFLRRGESYRFFVAGGKHRAAVLVHLGYNFVPVILRTSWPRVIERERAREWPLIRAGKVDLPLAEQIFDCYFE
jgi:hypothetical protein